jgi:hypothetical protein
VVFLRSKVLKDLKAHQVFKALRDRQDLREIPEI